MERHKLLNLAGYSLIGLLTLVTVLPIFGLIALITIKGAGRIDWQFLSEASSSMEKGGIFAPIYGTILITGLTIAIAVPVGILAAIYMAEYARKGKILKLIEFTIVNLAGIPSVVYALFGLGLFVLSLELGISLIAGALTMATLVLPLIITVTYQSLLAVPPSLKEASLALGASHLQTIVKISLPTALPGILTGVILATARIAGETAPVMFTAAAYYLPQLPESVYDKTMLLSYHLYAVSTQVTGVSQQQKYGITFVLIFLVLLLNALAIYLRGHLKKKMGYLG